MSAVATHVGALPAGGRVTATLFAAAALAFFLPFGTVSCEGEEVTVSGIELATYTVDGAEREGSLAADVEDHGAMALLALACALIGAVVSLLRGRGGGWAIAGLAALFLLAVNSDTILGPEIEYGPGYVLAVGGLAGAGLLRFGIKAYDRWRRGERIWTWIVALVLGTPAAAYALLWAAVSGGY